MHNPPQETDPDWAGAAARLKEQTHELAELFTPESAPLAWQRIEARRGEILEAARPELLAEIKTALLAGQACIKVANETAQEIRELAKSLASAEIETAAAEGALIIESEECQNAQKELDAIQTRIKEMRENDEFHPENPEAQALYAKTEGIFKEFDGESEGETTSAEFRESLERRIRVIDEKKIALKMLYSYLRTSVETLDALRGARTGPKK